MKVFTTKAQRTQRKEKEQTVNWSKRPAAEDGEVNHLKTTADLKEKADLLSHEIIGAAIEVHRLLGPGLLESAYEECLARELAVRDVAFERQVALPVQYKGIALDCAYRLDLVVEGLVIVELKAVGELAPIHEAQLLTYLRLTGLWLGLIINFNVPKLVEGIVRRVNG